MSRIVSPTIDPKEYEFFKNSSSRWWDEKKGPKILHALSKIMVPLIQEKLIDTGLIGKELADTPTPLEDVRILEVGCGGGILSEQLAKTGATVVGLDIVPELIEVANQHAALTLNPSLTKLTYLLETIEEHALNNPEKYDAVVVADVIEHVNEQEIFLNACAKCVKPGGSIFVATLNKTTKAWLHGIIWLEYILRIIPPGAHNWHKFISPQEVQRILENGKCSTKDVRGLSYSVINDAWSWIEDTSVFYAMHAVKN